MGVKTMKKKEKGRLLDYVYNKNSELLMGRQNDNSVGAYCIEPRSERAYAHGVTKKQEKLQLSKCHRFEKCTTTVYIIRQSHNIIIYSLYGNATNNNRIRVWDKKWWWPLLTNALDVTIVIVNTWKLQYVLCKHANSLETRRSKEKICDDGTT